MFNNRKSTIARFWNNIQNDLFPLLENCVGKLSPEYQRLAAILDLIRIEEFLPNTRFNFGRPIKDRNFIARSYIAKIVLKITHTKQLVKLLKTDKQLKVICGWDAFAIIPSESSFSRAFEVFAESFLPHKVHEALIATAYEGRVVGHIIKDSTPINAREKVLKKKGTAKERKKQMNVQYRIDKKNGSSRKQKQLKQNLSEMLNELPKNCDIGSKKGPHYIQTWKGYKLHVAVDDNCVPLSAILTSASLNDSEVAIPLAEKTKGIRNFYDLMDSAYDMIEIRDHSFSLGHIPIIDKHSRSKNQKLEKISEKSRKKLLNFKTAEDTRYKERFSKERFNALLKEYYGGGNIQYKGHSKVFCHLMFGVLTLAASTLLSCVT